MTALISLLARIGVPQSLRRSAAWAVAAIAALAGLAVIKGCYDRAVIERNAARA
jgi:hypothetical protein